MTDDKNIFFRDYDCVAANSGQSGAFFYIFDIFYFIHIFILPFPVAATSALVVFVSHAETLASFTSHIMLSSNCQRCELAGGQFPCQYERCEFKSADQPNMRMFVIFSYSIYSCV